MKRCSVLFLAAVCLLATPLMLAQQAAQGPPPMLTIYREEIKAGHRGAYSQTAAAWRAVLGAAKFPGHYLALNSMSGPNEAWYLEGAASFAEIEQREKMLEAAGVLGALDALSAADGASLSQSRTMRAAYRPALSYNAGVDLAAMRYFTVVTTRVRPGHIPAWTEMMRKLAEVHKRAGMSESYAIFQVQNGAPQGTFLMFIPVASLQRVDELGREHDEKMQAAFTAEEREMMAKVSAETVMFSESNLFSINPRTSYVSDEMRKRDPGFWAPK
jgi:hypothetical protein